MKQALHIFGKDVRHLWPLIAIVLLLVAAFTFSSVRLADPGNHVQDLRFLAGLLEVIVPAAYAWLIVTVVHQEPLSGDRQFWLTRPYRLVSLLAAKALFVFLFVSVTMLAKDCFIVAGLGFPVLSNLTGLLLRQFAWTAWVVLPALAAAVVTRKLQEVGPVGAGLAVLYALTGIVVRKSFWPGIEWIRDYFGMLLLLILCAAIVLWQYLRRETGKARVAVAVCSALVIVGLPLIPWNAAFAVQMLSRKPQVDLSRVQVTPDTPHPRSAVPVGEELQVMIALPLHLTGLPSGLTVAADGVRIAIHSGQREIWRSGWQPNWYGVKTEDYKSQVVYVDGKVFRSLENQPVTVRLSLGLTLLGDDPSVHVPARQQSFSFEGSHCQAPSKSFPPPIFCFAAVKAPPRALASLESSGIAKDFGRIETRSYAPYEAVLDQSPVAANAFTIFQPQDTRALWEAPDAHIVLTPQRPVAHFRRDVEFSDLRLADYVVPPGRLEQVR